MITITTEEKKVSKMRSRIEIFEAQVKYLKLQLKATENEDYTISMDHSDMELDFEALMFKIMKNIRKAACKGEKKLMVGNGTAIVTIDGESIDLGSVMTGYHLHGNAGQTASITLTCVFDKVEFKEGTDAN